MLYRHINIWNELFQTGKPLNHFTVQMGRMATKHNHGEGASPALHGRTLVVNWDHQGQSKVVALDTHSGKTKWSLDRDEVTSWSSPIVIEHQKRAIAVISGTKFLRGYDLETGKVLWQCAGLSNNIVATPVYEAGMVFAGSSYEKQAMMAIEAMKRFNPGCEHAKLRNFGMTIGIRDTRKIDAVYNMTSKDVHEQARFDDSIGIFPEFIDGYGILILPTTGRYFHVPYRTLLPKGVQSLICAGRITGGDRDSHAATRNMMCCTVTGQAAGVAAAISIKQMQAFEGVDVKLVQKELRRQEVRLQ